MTFIDVLNHIELIQKEKRPNNFWTTFLNFGHSAWQLFYVTDITFKNVHTKFTIAHLFT